MLLCGEILVFTSLYIASSIRSTVVNFKASGSTGEVNLPEVAFMHFVYPV